MKRPARWSPGRGDIIWIDFNPHVGIEMKDYHPLLVLSTKAFCERTGVVIGLPMTTAAYNEANPFAVRITWAGGNVSYVLAAQPKSFDWRKRGAKPHPMKQAPHAAFKSACSALNQIITIC